MAQYSLRMSMRDIASVEGWNAPQFVQLKLRQALPVNSKNPEIKWIDRNIASENFKHFLSLLRAQVNPVYDQNGSMLLCIPLLFSLGGFSLQYVAAIDCPERLSNSTFRRYMQQCWVATDWGYGELLIRPGGILGWENYTPSGRDRNDFFSNIDLANYQNIE
jgi:hypothetical protein